LAKDHLMPIEIKMPALSPTMEHGTLAKWLVKVGDTVRSGDLLAEIETDKATMEFEAVDEGEILSIAVAQCTQNVAVGTVIATLSGEDSAAPAKSAPAALQSSPPAAVAAAPVASPAVCASAIPAIPANKGDRVIASPLAKRLAAEMGVDLAGLKGSGPGGQIVRADVEAAKAGGAVAQPAAGPAAGAAPAAAGELISPLAKRLAAELGVDLARVKGTGPGGRIVKADVEAAAAGGAMSAPAEAAAPAATPSAAPTEMAEETRALLDARIPHSVEKLSGMRKTIARRLSQSMQTAPHIYLTVDIRLDKLLSLRGELNEVLAPQGVKLSVNDMLLKALGKALMLVPDCNVAFAGNELIRYARADISVAVSIPGGLITPIVSEADTRSLSSIALAMNDLATRAKEGRLKSEEYQGGTASLSNMGMLGIKQFTAVINPPQATILAIGAGEKRPWVMPDGTLGVASVMSATGSFDHRAVDGADGARLMAAFRELVEKPLGLVA
jgi:pyruvate dehydrogenase E2 component (dihydrolipoamide acetyltransferase)